MASVPIVLRRLRRARRECKVPPTIGRYRQYEEAYRGILDAVEELGGEETLDAVVEWALSWTDRHERLPTPERFRANAREICLERGLDIPRDSPLETNRIQS